MPDDEEVTPTSGGEPAHSPRNGLTVESRSQSDDANIEARVLDAMRAVPKGEVRQLVHSEMAPVLPTDLQTFLWDMLRPNSVILQSGVRVVTTQRKSVKWPRLTADMVPDFFAELEEIPATDVDFDQWELTPQKIAALARGSSEAFDDSDPDLLQIVTSNLATVLALKLDFECLRGDVAASAKGIGFDGMMKFAGQTLDAGGALSNYDPFLKAIGLLNESFIGPPYAIVTHSRVSTALGLIKEYGVAEANVGISPPPNFPPMYTTSQIGAKDDVTTALVYAPRLLTVVRRMDTTIEVDRSAEFTSDAVVVRGRIRVTLGTAYPASVVRIDNLPAPPIS